MSQQRTVSPGSCSGVLSLALSPSFIIRERKSEKGGEGGRMGGSARNSIDRKSIPGPGTYQPQERSHNQICRLQRKKKKNRSSGISSVFVFAAFLVHSRS